MTFVRFDPAALGPGEIARRRHRVVLLVLAIAGPAILTMADLHWRTGYDGWKAVHLVLFTMLFGLVALGAAQTLTGFFVRRRGGDPCRITATLSTGEGEKPVAARTAVVMPICNEEVGRVIEGVRVMYESLLRSGRFRFFHPQRFERPQPLDRGGDGMARVDPADRRAGADFLPEATRRH